MQDDDAFDRMTLAQKNRDHKEWKKKADALKASNPNAATTISEALKAKPRVTFADVTQMWSESDIRRLIRDELERLERERDGK